MVDGVEANTDEDPPETLVQESDLWPVSPLLGHATRRHHGLLVNQESVAHTNPDEYREWVRRIERSDALRTELAGLPTYAERIARLEQATREDKAKGVTLVG